MSTKPISSMEMIPLPTGMDVKEFDEGRRKARLGTKIPNAATKASGPAAETSSPSDEVVIPAPVKFEGLNLKEKEEQARLMTFEERDGYLKARCTEAQKEIDAGLCAAQPHFAVAIQIIRESWPFFDVHFEELDGQGKRTDLGDKRSSKTEWLKENLPGIHKSTFYKALNAAKREYTKLVLPETGQSTDGEVEPHKDSENEDRQDFPPTPLAPSVSTNPADRPMTVESWMEWRKQPHDSGPPYNAKWVAEADNYTADRHEYSLASTPTRKLINSLSHLKAVQRNAQDFAKFAQVVERLAQDYMYLAQAIQSAIIEAVAAPVIEGEQPRARRWFKVGPDSRTLGSGTRNDKREAAKRSQNAENKREDFFTKKPPSCTLPVDGSTVRFNNEEWEFIRPESDEIVRHRNGEKSVTCLLRQDKPEHKKPEPTKKTHAVKFVSPTDGETQYTYCGKEAAGRAIVSGDEKPTCGTCANHPDFKTGQAAAKLEQVVEGADTAETEVSL